MAVAGRGGSLRASLRPSNHGLTLRNACAPIVLTSRADSAEARSASCAIALLMAHAKRKQTS
jgi:phosphotransacetylase